MSKQFTNLVFKNEPDETTPLSAENLNLIQTNINNILKNNFGGYDTKYIENANDAVEDGIYLLGEDFDNVLPFTVNSIDPSWLIVITRQGDNNIFQLAIKTNDVTNIWIRFGSILEINNEKTFSGFDWTKLESILNIRTGYVRETNIQIEDTGKKVYVKRISGKTLPNTDVIALNTGISENVSMYKIEGMATNPESNNQTPIPYVRPSSAISVYYAKEENVIYIRTESDRSTNTYYIDFYFTYDD